MLEEKIEQRIKEIQAAVNRGYGVSLWDAQFLLDQIQMLKQMLENILRDKS